MKLALRTNCRSKLDSATLAKLASEIGYAGLEISAAQGSEPDAQEMAANGMTIACLVCEVPKGNGRRWEKVAAGLVRAAMETARLVASPNVKVAGVSNARLPKLATWLEPLGDEAIDQGVTLLIENRPPFATAHAMWLLMEEVHHPAIAAAWDVCTTAIAGESPWVSVPNLNSRIAYAVVRDAKITAAGAIPCPIGQGGVPLQSFVARLMGIGYQGWITVHPAANDAAPIATELANALAKLRTWSKPPEHKRPAHRPTPVKR